MQGLADHGPVTAIAPPTISFGLPGPIFSAGHPQHFGGPRRDAVNFVQPNGQRKRPWKGKNAQQRKRKGNNNNAPKKQGPNGVVKESRQRRNKNIRRVVETPRSLPSGAPLNVAHLAVTEAMKPGGAHIPDMFSPSSTPAATRSNRDPDNDINFFGTNFGLVQDYPSESATDANASDTNEEDDNGGAKETAYTMSLEQKVESLTQVNLNLQEELWVSKQELQDAKEQIRELQERLSTAPAAPETSQEGNANQEERSR